VLDAATALPTAHHGNAEPEQGTVVRCAIDEKPSEPHPYRATGARRSPSAWTIGPTARLHHHGATPDQRQTSSRRLGVPAVAIWKRRARRSRAAETCAPGKEIRQRQPGETRWSAADARQPSGLALFSGMRAPLRRQSDSGGQPAVHRSGEAQPAATQNGDADPCPPSSPAHGRPADESGGRTPRRSCRTPQRAGPADGTRAM